MLSNRISLDIR